MGDTEPYLCPDCGWTGREDDLDVGNDGRLCPACARSLGQTT